MMKRTLAGIPLWLLLLAPWLALPSPALATGTSAGVDIRATATAEYSIGDSRSSVTSNTAIFRVDQILDVTLSWQNADHRPVGSPDSDQVLSYLLTNTGNGDDSYSLSVENGLGGDQFAPEFVDIYLDADGNGLLDPEFDTLYITGRNDPQLTADAARVVFVRNNIPADLHDGDLGSSQLNATSNTGSGAPGTTFDGAGNNGITAVVGASGGTDGATGSYQVSGAGVSLLKSVAIVNPLGGEQPVTGALMTYRIEVTVSGTARANGVVITDSIPANTSYVPASLTLNDEALTDAADGDAGDVGDSRADTVTVDLGDLNPGSPTRIITFDVLID
ncbi:DUF11 domain-containing protein [Thiohalomonas denitrificans]|uniref:DUF11 domain-containing protein n=1 Tax=Thiohalomonas denitrificans TaxID=415747 RepID=UPI0026EBB9FD|nr:DUF11 domain-containing protein [Thiohalomonas denitrificans]